MKPMHPRKNYASDMTITDKLRSEIAALIELGHRDRKTSAEIAWEIADLIEPSPRSYPQPTDQQITRPISAQKLTASA